jgi:hypothetical protein
VLRRDLDLPGRDPEQRLTVDDEPRHFHTLAHLPFRGETYEAGAAEINHVSEKHAVECLHCGTFRTVTRERTQRLDPGECGRCGYLGWALVADLAEPVQKGLRERPLERRRLRVVT